MSASPRKSLMSVLLSVPVLTPVILGGAAYVLMTQFAPAHRKLGLFLAAFGALASVGTLMTLMLLRPRVSPEVARKRREALETLDDLADPARYPAAVESDRLAAAAPTERP
jgi:hypothetical protein